MNETLQETPEYTPEPSQALMVQTAKEVDVPSTQALTPQQARVDAVASVLHKAYERASTLQLTPEEVKALKEDFPDDAFKLGAGGNPELIYIEHAHLRDRFDAVIGMGQWALVRSRPHWAEEYVTQKGQKAVRIYADCALLIRGCFMAEAIGEMTYYPNNASQSYGDAAEGSETAAFRRCAKKIGVGLQAWKKDYCIGWTQRHKAGPAKTEYRQQVVSRIQTPPPVAKPDYDTKETPAQRKERFLAKFKGMESYAKELWIEMGIILPTEDFKDFPEDKVPATARVVYDMVQEVKKRAGVSETPSEEPPPSEPSPTAGRTCPNCQSTNYVEMRSAGKVWWKCSDCGRQGSLEKDAEGRTIKQVMSTVTGAEEAWRSFPVPEWSKHNKEEGYKTFGDLPKEKLWWWCMKWEPKPYKSPKNGKTYPVKQEEKDLRDMLDTVKDQYDFKDTD